MKRLVAAVLLCSAGCQTSPVVQVVEPPAHLLQPCIPTLEPVTELMPEREFNAAMDRNAVAVAVALGECNNKLREIERFFDAF